MHIGGEIRKKNMEETRKNRNNQQQKAILRNYSTDPNQKNGMNLGLEALDPLLSATKDQLLNSLSWLHSRGHL